MKLCPRRRSALTSAHGVAWLGRRSRRIVSPTDSSLIRRLPHRERLTIAGAGRAVGFLDALSEETLEDSPLAPPLQFPRDRTERVFADAPEVSRVRAQQKGLDIRGQIAECDNLGDPRSTDAHPAGHVGVVPGAALPYRSLNLMGQHQRPNDRSNARRVGRFGLGRRLGFARRRAQDIGQPPAWQPLEPSWAVLYRVWRMFREAQLGADLEVIKCVSPYFR